MKQSENAGWRSAVTTASPAAGRRKPVAKAGATPDTGATAESATETVSKPMPKVVVEARKFLDYDDRGSEAIEPRGARPVRKEIRIEVVRRVAVIIGIRRIGRRWNRIDLLRQS